MVKKYLVTTADESTWPKDNPIVFLGEWCKRYPRKDYWESFASDTVNYHWHNAEKMQQDYEYLQDIYERLLIELSSHLNTVHGVNHPLKYWRMIIGPWLGSFIHIIFDRLSMLNIAMDEHDLKSCKVHSNKLTSFIPNDMLSYAVFTRSDSWNEFIFGQLLTENNNIEIELLPQKSNNRVASSEFKYKNNQSLFRRTLIKVFNI